MTQRSFAVLVIINAVLLAAIAMTFGPGTTEVQAQGIGAQSYLMIAGDTQQRQQQAVIYVMQVNTGRVAAFLLNSANGDVDIVGARDVSNDINEDQGR